MNKPIKQNKYRQNTIKEELAVAREEWEKLSDELLEKIKDLGFKPSLKKFITVNSENLSDIALWSEAINIQNEVKDLLEQKKQLWPEDAIVEELNKKHATIHTDKFYILTEKIDPVNGGIDFSLESKQSFINQYENKLVVCSDGKKRSKANVWLKSPSRREFRGIVFSLKNDKKGFYNLWKGFTKEPKKGDCSLYWNHVSDNICSKKDIKYEYVRRWLAYIFQHPEEVHTALVLCGSQGVGKNSFVEPLGVLLGQHYTPLSSISELVSNFNYHLKHSVLIHANEALWGGNKKELGTLKAMVTDSSCLIEGKGKDRIVVRNFKHIILSSNENWPVHLDPDDRRFFVLNVSDLHKEDLDYFEAIAKQLKNGGYEALLYDLLNQDLTNFNPRILPETEDAFNIKLKSSGSSNKYIYEVLSEGRFGIGADGGTRFAVWQDLEIDEVYMDYVSWCQINGEKQTNKSSFGKNIKALIPSIKITRPAGTGRRPRIYKFPLLEKAREEFCKAYKASNNIWMDDGEV